jgi:hypothetical protein
VVRVAVGGASGDVDTSGGGGGGGEGEGGGGGVLTTKGAWDEVRGACTAVLQRHISHIPKCRCGF